VRFARLALGFRSAMQGADPWRSHRGFFLRSQPRGRKRRVLWNGAALTGGFSTGNATWRPAGNPITVSFVSGKSSVRRQELQGVAVAGSHFIPRRGGAMSTAFFHRSAILAVIGVLAVGLAGVGLDGSPKAAEKSWGFDTANLDKTCKPCDDFYQFAMGGW